MREHKPMQENWAKLHGLEQRAGGRLCTVPCSLTCGYHRAVLEGPAGACWALGTGHPSGPPGSDLCPLGTG